MVVEAKNCRVWQLEDSNQRAIFVERADGSYVEYLDDGTFRRQYSGVKGRAILATRPTPVQPNLQPNHYYPRMWRGGSNTLNALMGDREARTASITATSGIYDMLASIYRTIEPDPDNKAVFGQDLRMVHILACCEVEAACRGVLNAHGYTIPPEANRRHPNMRDYWKLCGPMRLDQFMVKPRLFPKWGEIRPFKGWGEKSHLDWYQDYHAVKHDGAVSLAKANLGNVISAVAALDILLDAQFGLDTSSEIAAPKLSQFLIEEQPTWKPEEGYYRVVEPETNGRPGQSVRSRVGKEVPGIAVKHPF